MTFFLYVLFFATGIMQGVIEQTQQNTVIPSASVMNDLQQFSQYTLKAQQTPENSVITFLPRELYESLTTNKMLIFCSELRCAAVLVPSEDDGSLKMMLPEKARMVFNTPRNNDDGTEE